MTIKDVYYSLVKEFGTTNPFNIAGQLGITVLFNDLGTNNGLYHTLEICKKTYHYIHINNNLSDDDKRYTMAHELGHFILHKNSNLHFLRRISRVPLSRQEIEADLFASYFIISDEEINNISHISKSFRLDYRICEERIKYLDS